MRKARPLARPLAWRDMSEEDSFRDNEDAGAGDQNMITIIIVINGNDTTTTKGCAYWCRHEKRKDAGRRV